ncbi:hypothetical protein GCM10025866_31810 [Naasia aerilata]|uniref:Uncharacterized protein n=1 Tax=Naasia aerilata TaxID=1162966 RepID=A0ABN6XQK0_9MICO|nr:hypothetical protein GCM10025866_31810 [Naasia aerilata]
MPAQLTVAIEDSRPGLASAMSAGATAIGVPHTVDLPSGNGYTVWPTLAGRHIPDLVALLPGAPEVDDEELAS